MKFKSKSGFTLIELLVVVAIISLLASIVMASLNSARSKARDAKRKEDLHQIGLALQLYYDAYGQYPPPKNQNQYCGGGDIYWSHSKGTCGGQWLTTDANFYQFMSSVPVDPVNTGSNAGLGDGNYVYSYYPSLANNQDYELVTQLENSSDKQTCGYTPSYYHNVPGWAWCGQWPSGTTWPGTTNMGRSMNIYADH